MRLRLAPLLTSAGLIAFLGACATIAPGPPAGPSAGAVEANLGFPPPGTKWTVRIMHDTGGTTRTSISILSALGEGTYKGRPVYRITDGEELIYDNATANLVAIVQRGKEVIASSPHEGTFSWPLWVGKSWIASFTHYDHVRKSSTPVKITWKVDAYEDVHAPAGTWKAFRLRGSSPAGTTTIWYAPEIKLMVKRIFERAATHPLGYGKTVTEVIQYPAK